jgi:hypothetical protein
MYRLTVDCTTMNYYFQKLKCSERLADVACEIRKNHNVWGSFKGLFGLAGDELITITQAQVTDSTTFNVVESQVWQPTARPTTSTPLSKEGLYVFRQFVTQPEHLPAMVELSTEAWLTFESAENFRAQPMGLFQPADLQQDAEAHGNVTLTLLTWYDGFSSWETSRSPDPHAQENFHKRHQLTQSTSAIATRLVLDA